MIGKITTSESSAILVKPQDQRVFHSLDVGDNVSLQNPVVSYSKVDTDNDNLGLLLRIDQESSGREGSINHFGRGNRGSRRENGQGVLFLGESEGALFVILPISCSKHCLVHTIDSIHEIQVPFRLHY